MLVLAAGGGLRPSDQGPKKVAEGLAEPLVERSNMRRYANRNGIDLHIRQKKRMVIMFSCVLHYKVALRSSRNGLFKRIIARVGR